MKKNYLLFFCSGILFVIRLFECSFVRLFCIWLFASYIFFSSYSSSAQSLQWAKAMGGTNSDAGYSIAVDASGNVYTAGYFDGTVDFDPGAGTFNITSAGIQDIFISKLNASGNFIWAKSMGGTNSDAGLSIAVDVSGNVYTTGYFDDTADFDPGVGVYNLTSAGGADIFVSKLDASGNFLWAKSMGGTSDENGYSIAVDASGNVYTTGRFLGTADFDPGTGVYNLTPAGGADIFVSKLDISGDFLWARQIGGTSYDEGYSIAVDASGNVYTTGYFQGTVDFDPSAGVYNLTSAGGVAIFISSLDATGNFLWAKAMTSTSGVLGKSIAVNVSGNVYTTGYFQGTADFDPGAGVYNLTTPGDADIFVSKLDASGNFLWARQMGGTSYDLGNSIAADASGNVYTAGRFQLTADFDPGAGAYNLISAGNNDIFVSKLDASGNFLWANAMGDVNDDYGYSIAADGAGNVYTTGIFSGTVDFNSGVGVYNLTSAGNSIDIFVSKYCPCNVSSFSITQPSCNGYSDGSATVTASEGTPPYAYLWSNGQTNATATGLSAGTYTITVTESLGCAATETVAITQPSGMSLSTAKTNIDCSGNCIGSATVTATGGTSPYTYAWSSGETTSATNNNLCSGNYSVMVTDAGGCTMSASVAITTPTALSFSFTQINVSCFGGNNGSISVNASGGSPAYQYSKDGGSNYQSSSNFTGLTAGTYSVVVKDNNGCQTSVTILTISEPSVLSLSTSQTTADCYGGSNATATAIAAGGSGSYTYLWNPTSATTSTATGLSPGNYSVTVTDNNNCTVTASVTIVSSITNPVTCQVTVDSLSQYNVIIWDKPVTQAIDTFIIYRDTANNNFAPIGKVPYDSLSQFIDTVQALYAANGDPNASTWKYKIAVMDTCGNISPISAYHKTLFIQNNSGNFTWNDYLIEGQPVPVPALSNYLFQRDDFSLGNYVTIQTLSASSLAYTDAAYATYQSTATWRVRTLWGISCSSQLTNPQDEKGINPVPTATVNTTRSNTFKTTTVTATYSSQLEKNITVYPNPAAGKFHVSGTGHRVSRIELYNTMGEKVFALPLITQLPNQPITVTLPSWLGQGIYFLKIISDKGTMNKKIIITR